MGILERLMGRVTGTAKQPEPGGRDGDGTTERNVGGRQAGTPVPPEPPVLPLDDDGNDARNIGG
jgi:hypothetical protein